MNRSGSKSTGSCLTSDVMNAAGMGQRGRGCGPFQGGIPRMPSLITPFGKGSTRFHVQGEREKNSITLRSEKGWRASIPMVAASLPECSKKNGRTPQVKLQECNVPISRAAVQTLRLAGSLRSEIPMRSANSGLMREASEQVWSLRPRNRCHNSNKPGVVGAKPLLLSIDKRDSPYSLEPKDNSFRRVFHCPERDRVAR